MSTAQLYRVTPGDRLAFYRTSDCDAASCSEHAYVVPGDRVVVWSQKSGRACVMFSAARDMTGWVDARRLHPDVPAGHPALSAWLGDWYDGDDHIRLTNDGAGRLSVDGDAYWPGAHPAGDYPNGPNIGSLGGTARPIADRLDYADDEGPTGCRATLRLLGRYLLVQDNGNCGGMNVRFTGNYRRRPRSR